MIEQLRLQVMTEADIANLTLIMTRAFDEDTKLHLNEEKGGPEGYDNGEFLRRFGLSKQSTTYKILIQEEVVGAVILWINEQTHINFLGCLFVDPLCQNKGLGQAIWQLIENKYPQTQCWKTETPGFSRRNHYFYVNKCGFSIVEIQNPKDKYEANYVMEKMMK